MLLVEDGIDNQLLIASILRKAVMTVEVAENGQVGLDKALAVDADFDLILIDMQMPVMDGYTATRVLRRSGYARPIVALTAHAMNQDREKCLAAGCSAYTTKPIRRRELLQLIEQQLLQSDCHAEV